MDHAPFLKQKWGVDFVTLQADHRAWYTLEKTTGKPYGQTVACLVDPGRQSPQATYLLLWALTATQRATEKQSYLFTDEDRRLGMEIPSSFVNRIPCGEAFKVVETGLLELLLQAGLIGLEEQDKSGRPIPPPSESIGGGEP